MEHDVRPWGQYWVLDDASTHKVKRIEVEADERLSYQYHLHRSEAWTIVAGIGRITLDGVVKDYQVGDTVVIPQGVKHRIENPFLEPLIFIEVQYGSYFGEDDIIRLEDDYRRQ